MHRSNPVAGQHRIGGLGDHRHIKYHAIALAHAEGFIDIGQLANLCVQLRISDMRTVLRVVAFPDDCGLIAARGEVAINTIRADVQLAIFIPLN